MLIHDERQQELAAQVKLQQGFEIGPFAVLPDRNIVRQDGNDTHLEPKQMQALLTLARHHPGVVSKQQLADDVWSGRPTSDESITGCIKGLRAALDNDNPRKPKYIETIHGRGYRLKLPPSVTEPAPVTVIPRQRIVAAIAGVIVLGTSYFLIDSLRDSPPPQIDSVVITRFANMSSEATQPTVDGFTEQLISTLYEVPNLQIKKGDLPAEHETARDITDRYDVGWVVFGSVQQMDGQVKIIARIDDRDSVVEWAGTFTGTDSDIFALHEQVATKVRDAIRGVEQEAVTASSKPASPAAYDKYLLGQFYLAKRNKSSLDQAVGYLGESIRADPGYGPAYLELANTYMLLADYGEREVMFDLAIETVEEGARQDPGIRDAGQTVHGYVHTKRGNWILANEAFSIAINSAIEYPPSLHYYSRLMAAVGRMDASLDAAISAWEMEPDAQVLNSRLAITYFWLNDMANARRYYEVANALGPGAPIHQLSYALFLIRDDRLEEAREIARRAMILFESDPGWVDPAFDALVGSPGSAGMDIVLGEYAAENSIPANVLMTFLVIAGNTDEAIDVAYQLVDQPALFDIELIYLDEFRNFRQHAAFPQLTDQLGLSDYWQITGCRWSNDNLAC